MSIPCFSCRNTTVKKILKDQIWQMKSGEIVHSVLVPELIVNFCDSCDNYTIDFGGDDQLTEAKKLHISKPCGCSDPVKEKGRQG